MSRWVAASIFALAACIAAPGAVQAQAGRVPTVTRLVKLFAERESALATQARSTDAGALEQLLDPSFEVRLASAPGVPIPRDEWIRQTRASPHRTPRLEQMAVHDFGDVAVVSFREADEPDGTGAPAPARFIVDCWKRSGDAWQLAVRYSSDAPPLTRRPPGGTIDKRY